MPGVRLRAFSIATLALTLLFLPCDAAAQKLVTAGGTGTPPSVRVVDASGTDQNFLAYDPAFVGGVRLALGDVNGDGVLDVITAPGPGGGPHVRIWDGATLTEIGGFFAYNPAFPGGVFVAAGDVNGDGRADIITGAGPGGGPHVRIWDGATFTEIAGFFAYNSAFPGGVSVAAGDVNGDGLADIVTGAGPGGGPHVRVWNGADLSEIGGFFAYNSAFPGGVNVAAGDVDGDGLADIITGAGPGGGPHVRVWSGATFTEIGGFFAYDAAFPGGVTVGLTDLNRDGRNEIMTGPATGMPVIRLWDGSTFALFGEYLAYDPGAGGGAGVFIGSVAENPSTDDAPRVESSVPANGATGVAVDSDLTVTFSEAVTAGVGAFLLECPTGTPIPLTISASPATMFTLHPTAPLPVSTSCSLRVVASEITDEDTDDPPDRPTANSTINFTTAACPAITILPTTVPGGNATIPYAPVTFTQTGGTAPITWTITAGTPPAGMNLSAAGVLNGTPTQTGAFPLTITATAAGGCTGSVSLVLNIAAGPNQEPSFVAGPNQTVLEDAGPQTVANWATAINPGAPDEAGQTLSFVVTANTNAALFTIQPTVLPNGTLLYTPAPNANGTASITLELRDNGGTALGGDDTSPPQTFTITVTAVNDAPTFTGGANQTVLEDAGAQTVVGWATAISAGAPDEAAQTLTFQVTNNTNAALFSVVPSVSSTTGNLTYTPAANTSGTATITLVLGDNGGLLNGGANTSAPFVFTITVTAVDDPPTADNDSYTVAEGGTLSVAAPGVLDGDNDPEGDTLTAVLVTGPANASSFTLNADGSFTYTHNGSETTTDSFTYRAVANGVQSANATVTITITPVNDAPVITAGATLNYTEGNPATAIDATVTVADADTPNMAFASVQITGAYVAGQDVLAFPGGFGISSIFVPATGTLTLSGSQPVANYQAALRTVTYVNTSASPSIAPRTVTWSVSDGVLPSNFATSTITVTAINSGPNGVADTWETFGNTELRVGTGTTATPHVLDATPANGVLANDSDPEGDAISVVGLVGAGCGAGVLTCATAGGGSVTIQANGAFSYTPQAGDVTSDSFQYIVRDAPLTGTPVSVNVTVNLTLHGRIWYVNGNVVGPGTGTSSDPFNALPATVGDADDYIFVHDSTVTSGITLQNGQKLYGEAFGLSINQALNGNAAPTVLVAAGGRPNINVSSGNAVTVLANTASGNLTNIEIRGLSLSTTAPSSNAIDVTTADAANVAVTIDDVEATGATAEGIDINQASTGSATIAISNVIVNATGTGIDLNETAGTLTVTAFSDLAITGDTGGSGIVVTNATFDATPGGAYNQVAGGSTAVGLQANPVGGAGVVLTNVSGDLAFTDLDIFTSAGAGLQVTGTGAVNVGAGTGTRVAVAPADGTLQSIGGPVVSVLDSTVDLQLASASVTSSTTTGISLTTATGSVAAAAGSIANTTGISVAVSGGTVSLSYGGNITQTSNVAMVSVSGHTSGTITFSGTLNATNGTGLQFDNADSTTSYNFTGTTTLNGGDAGIDILNGSAGTFTFGTGTTITNPSGSSFAMSASPATVTFSGSISDTTGFAVDINGLTAGTVTFQTGSIVANGTGTAIRVVNSTGGVINFNSPTIALTTGASNAVNIGSGGPNTGGTITFAPTGGNGLDISTTTGLGFLAQQGGTVTVTGAGNTINSTGAMAIELSGVTIGASGVNFASTTSGGGVRNVKLTNVTGGAIALGGGSLTASTGAAFLVGDGVSGANTGGTSVITYLGNISSTGTARAVEIQDRPAGAGNITLSGTISHAAGNANVIFLDSVAAGTISFSGANSVLNGGTSTAVSLTNNPGATINFTGGGLDIDATSGNGFHASSSGTVSVTGTGNTIATTTGIALNVTGTTIGASGMTFQSIAANGAVNGIVLSNTGTTGLTVTGNGGTCTSAATCTGGAIQNTTNDGVSLTNAHNVSLTRMAFVNVADAATDITNCDLDTATGCAASIDIQAASSNITLSNILIDGDDGIDGAGGANPAGQIGISANGVNGLSLTNSTIKNVGENNEESAMLLVDPQGSVTVTDVMINDPSETGIRVYKLANTTLNMTLTRVTVQNNISTFGEQGLSIRADGGTAFVLVDDCDFLNTDGMGVDGQAINSAILHLTVQNSTFNENHALPHGINFVTDNTAQGFVRINNNTITGCAVLANCSLGIDIDANRTSTLHAIVTNNTVSNTGIGGGMEFVVGDGAFGRAEIRDNSFTVPAGEIGMTFFARSEGFGGTNGRLDVLLEGNTINGISSGGLFVPGVQLLAGASTGTHDQDMCVNVATAQGAGNNSINGTNTPGLTPRFEVRQRTGTSFFLQGFTGTGTSDVSVASYFDTNNSGTLGGAFVGTGGTNIVNYAAGTCNAPTPPTLPQ
jgi:VCBS repeat-containing protein